MKKYVQLETEKAKVLAELKNCSLKIKGLIDDEERMIKRNREARHDIDKEKSVIGARVLVIQKELDEIEASLPRAIHIAVSERETEVTRVEFAIREARQELQGRKFEIKQMRDKGGRSADLQEPQAEITRLEEHLEGLESDLAEAKASHEAAVILKREALEAAAEKAPVG